MSLNMATGEKLQYGVRSPYPLQKTTEWNKGQQGKHISAKLTFESYALSPLHQCLPTGSYPCEVLQRKESPLPSSIGLVNAGLR